MSNREHRRRRDRRTATLGRLPAGLLALLAGCYSPRLREGAPCDSTQQCPSPQNCVLGQCLFRDKRPVDAEVVADAAADAEIVIDARPDAAVLPCTADGLVGCGTATVFSCGGHCWVSCSTATTRAKASTACTGWQGALGQIDDAAEQSCVVSHAGSVSWIGLVQSDAATAPAQGWVWNTDANPVVYTNWRPPDPDDGGGGGERHAEQCGLIQVGTQWDDVNCAEQQRFLCER